MRKKNANIFQHSDIVALYKMHMHTQWWQRNIFQASFDFISEENSREIILDSTEKMCNGFPFIM